MRHYASLKVLLSLLGLCVLSFSGCRDPRIPQTTQPPPALGQHRQAIVGAQPDLRYPAIGALTRAYTVFCSGTLIAPRVVLTAGHCVDTARGGAIGGEPIHFRIDKEDPNQAEGFVPRHFAIDPRLLLTHPQWTPGRVASGFDIGVAILREAVPDTLATPFPVQLTPLPSITSPTLRFLGYGLIASAPHAISPNRKYGADIPLLEVRSSHVFTGGGGQGICHGDSGGPALTEIDGTWHVIAVNSYGQSSRVPGSDPPRISCDGRSASVRTDIYSATILDWIGTYSTLPRTCTLNDTRQQCGPCQRCVQDQCTPAPPPPAASWCNPCKQDADCGTNSRCVTLPEGRRCVDLCTQDRCCLTGASCTSVVTTNGRLPICLPDQGTCPTQACTQDTDCPTDSRCIDSTCQTHIAPRSATLCHPCQEHTDCASQDHVCQARHLGGLCLQPCDPDGRCPTGFTCRSQQPGFPKQCVPRDGRCLIPCQQDSACPQGLSCQQGRCLRPQGGQPGDACEKATCATGLRCIDTLEGARCLRPCRIEAGQIGGACLETRACTDANSSCLVIRGLPRRFCIERCQSSQDCTYGGLCIEGHCVCGQDQECRADANCETDFGASTGFCQPRMLPLSCPTGQRCTYLGQGSFCAPADDALRDLGQTCDAFFACKPGLRCYEHRRRAGRCVESCRFNTDCTQGGICTNGICSCADDRDCRDNRLCQVLYDSPRTTPQGLCIPGPTATPCHNDSPCGQGLRCLQGRCLPAPTEPIAEPSDEPSNEPLAEQPLGEETSPDEPPQEAAPPETTDASKIDDATPPEFQRPQPETPKGSDPSLTPDGCNCTQSPWSGHSWPLALLLLIGLRRRIPNIFH